MESDKLSKTDEVKRIYKRITTVMMNRNFKVMPKRLPSKMFLSKYGDAKEKVNNFVSLCLCVFVCSQ